MSHTELSSKEDFQKAIETPGKYVFILAYDGDKPADADRYAVLLSDPVVLAFADEIQATPKSSLTR